MTDNFVEEFTEEDAYQAEQDLLAECDEAIAEAEEREFNKGDEDDFDEDDMHGSHSIDEPDSEEE